MSSANKIFISYAREDQKIAKKLYRSLQDVGLSPWLDIEDLLPGQNWEVTIKETIRNSSFFLALLSSNSVSKKGFIQKELKFALDLLKEYPYSKVFIIPIRLDECKPFDEKINELHRVDLFIFYKQGVNKILYITRKK